MQDWMPCGESFITADVIRWTEDVFDGPFARNGRKARRGRAVCVGEREVVAEVLNHADAKGFVHLLVRACLLVSARDNVPVAPKPLKIGEEIRRQNKTLVNGNLERLPWSDESAREAVVRERGFEADAAAPVPDATAHSRRRTDRPASTKSGYRRKPRSDHPPKD